MASRKDIQRTFGSVWVGFCHQTGTVTITNLKTKQTASAQIPVAHRGEFKQYMADTDTRISYSGMLDRCIAFLEGANRTPAFIQSAIDNRLPLRTASNEAVIPERIEASTGRVFCATDSGLVSLYAPAELFPIGKEYAEATSFLRGTPAEQRERQNADIADAIIRNENHTARILGA